MILILLLVASEPSSCPTQTVALPTPSSCALTPQQVIATRAARVSVELALGVALGTPAEVSGGFIGLSIDIATGQEIGAGLPLGLILGSLGVAPGVWLGGHAMGGGGSFGWTLLGNAIGTTASTALLLIDGSPVTLAFAALFPLLGAILGYELSSPHRREPSKPKDGVMIVPALSPTSVGIAGAF